MAWGAVRGGTAEPPQPPAHTEARRPLHGEVLGWSPWAMLRWLGADRPAPIQGERRGCPTTPPALTQLTGVCAAPALLGVGPVQSHAGDAAPGVRGGRRGAGARGTPRRHVPAALRGAGGRHAALARAVGEEPDAKEREVVRLGLPGAVASPSAADAVGHLTSLGSTGDGALWSLSISVWWSQSRAVKAWKKGQLSFLGQAQTPSWVSSAEQHWCAGQPWGGGGSREQSMALVTVGFTRSRAC